MTDDEEFKFRVKKWGEISDKRNQQSYLTSVIKDVISPLPFMDDMVVGSINSMIEQEDNKLLLFEKSSYGKSYGVAGIVWDKIFEHETIALAASEGLIVKDGFSGKETKKYLIPEDQEMAKWNLWADRFYMLGILPSDIGSATRKMQRNLAKSALTEIQMEKYKLLIKENGKVTAKDLEDIRSGKKVGRNKNAPTAPKRPLPPEEYR
tara:strand:- start:355 stop:975 length:621 start_codon:yes stop_codon:yes gene_type:complete